MFEDAYRARAMIYLAGLLDDTDRGSEATELGVERELPLTRSILARAHLARGELAPAVDRARAAVEAANGLTIAFPMAVCLETAALVLQAAGLGSRDLSRLLACADVIRASGDRPSPVPLAAAVQGLRASLGPAQPMEADSLSPPEAGRLATKLLADIAH